MKSWKLALKDALIVGSIASVASLAALALRSRVVPERKRPAAPSTLYSGI